MRAKRIDEKQLEIDVPFDKIYSWPTLPTIHEISLFNSNKFMESVLDSIPIYHIFIGPFNLGNLFFYFTLKNFIEFLNLFIFLIFSPVCFMLLKYFTKEHFQCRNLKDSSIGYLFSKVSIID